MRSKRCTSSTNGPKMNESLSYTVLLDLGIGHRLFLLDRLTQLPVIHPLPLQLHLVSVEDALESICTLFGELTAFPVQLTRVVYPLAGSIGPPLHVVESSLEGFPLFRDL